MASLILGVVGGILLPGFGAVLGGLAGAAIDAFLISPMLFGGQDSQQIGPRLDDLNIQTAAEGSPVQYCLDNAVQLLHQHGSCCLRNANRPDRWRLENVPEWQEVLPRPVGRNPDDDRD